MNRRIKTSDFRDDIFRLGQYEYFPFNNLGNGNMGYLFELNRELAKIFIEAQVKLNPFPSTYNTNMQ